MALMQRTLTGVSWNVLANGLQFILQIFVLVLLARLLTPEDFGRNAIALIVIGLVSLVPELLVGPSLVQRNIVVTADIQSAMGISSILGLVLTAAIFFGSYAAEAFGVSHQFGLMLRIMSPIVALRGLTTVSRHLLQREMRFRALAAIQVGGFGFGFAAVAVAAASYGLGGQALALGYLAQAVLEFVFTFALRPVLPRLIGWLGMDFGYGRSYALGEVANFAATRGDYVVVGAILGSASLGLYNRAYVLMTAPATLVGTAADRALFPALASIQSDQGRLAAAFLRAVGLIALVSLPLGILLAVVGPELIEIVLGPGWQGATGAFQVLSIGLLFRMGYKVSDSLARATGESGRRAFVQLAYALAVMAGAAAGAFWGLEGVAAGVLAAIMLNYMLMARISLRRTGLQWGLLLKSHKAAFASGVVVLAVGLAVASLARNRAWTDLAVLGTTIPACMVALILSALAAPKMFLGESGQWLCRRLSLIWPGIPLLPRLAGP